MHRRGVLPALALFGWTATASAYRPFDGTDADVAARGELELEVGTLGYLHGRDGTYLAPAQVINYGPVERVELVLEGRPVLPAYRAALDRFALADPALSLKSVLRRGALQDAPGPSIALELAALLPTFHAEPGAGASVALIVSERVGFLTLHLNLLAQRTRAKNVDGIVDLILEGPPLLARTRPVGEISFEHEANVTSTGAWLFGFISQLSERYSLDLATRYVLSGRDRVFELRSGFTWDIDLLGWSASDRDE